MKKSLIALAIAAASTSAFAAADISGQIKVIVAGDNYTPSFDNELTAKTSDDLGGGLSAFGQVTLDLDATAADANQMKDMKVGVKGAFGTVIAGRMETIMEGVVSEQFNDGASVHTGVTQTESNLTAIGRVNAVAYVSPTVNGFHVAVAGTLDGADTDLFTHVDMAAVYDLGTLKLIAAKTDFATGDDITAYTASYGMGDVTIAAGRFEQGTADDTIVSVNYKMGPIGLYAAHKSSSATDGDVTSLKATYALSKSTAVWVGNRSKQGANADVTHFGIITKF